jgi:TetR/AcrR family transcriptional repressor of lmrAB and yxaGH operons
MAPAQKHRESLISAASGLFQRQGYAGTGLAEILAESGAPRGSLYHYFPEGKEEVGEEAVREAGAIAAQRFRDAGARLGDPRKLALAYGRAMAETLEGSGFSRGCPIATVVLECGPGSARIAAAASDVFASWCAVWTELLVQSGIAAPRAAVLAELVLSSVQGAMIFARVRRSTEPVLNAAAEMARLIDAEIKSEGQAI